MAHGVHILAPEEYLRRRENYDYKSCDCRFSIIQTGRLTYFGDFVGIFPNRVPQNYPNGVNLRKFEHICYQVFQDARDSISLHRFDTNRLANLKNIVAAIVYWKMASQGGRAPIKVRNMLEKWDEDTPNKLIRAFESREVSEFKIGGVRIPTATAFLRFLYPEDFGIMDSHVVANFTQPRGITNLNLRSDGYINDTISNAQRYHNEYIRFLRMEANWLNQNGFTYSDIDRDGNPIASHFRACDIEMALFQSRL